MAHLIPLLNAALCIPSLGVVLVSVPVLSPELMVEYVSQNKIGTSANFVLDIPWLVVLFSIVSTLALLFSLWRRGSLWLANQLLSANKELVASASAQKAAKREWALREQLQVQNEELSKFNRSLVDALRSLHASETRHRVIADNIYDWEFLLSPEGKFLYCSPSCQSSKKPKGQMAPEWRVGPKFLTKF